MLNEKLKKYTIILASQSPRRQYLLRELGVDFKVRPVNVEETYPAHLKHREIAIYLSELKAGAFDFEQLCNDCLIITADTIVWLNGEVMPKPENRIEAMQILQQLSGKMHEVITGVTLRTNDRLTSFYSVTKVFFKHLTDDEIGYYIDNYEPFDKAGAYGVQEWIGYIGIEKIEGSYFNVVGLPVTKLYDELMKL